MHIFYQKKPYGDVSVRFLFLPSKGISFQVKKDPAGDFTDILQKADVSFYIIKIR